MTFIIVMLWVLVALRVIKIFTLPFMAGKTVPVEYTPNVVASQSFFSVLSIVILALAAIGLANAVG